MDYLHTATLLGAKQVLTKPFNTEVLLAAVNEVLADQNAIPEKPSETVASNTMSD
jgi:DNA-binding response OmpR family regulator